MLAQSLSVFCLPRCVPGHKTEKAADFAFPIYWQNPWMESSGCYTSLRQSWFHIQAPVGISIPHLHRWKHPKSQRRWLFCTTPYLVIVVWNLHRGVPSRKFCVLCSMLHYFSIHWKDENGCFVIRWSHQDREGKQKERKRESQLAEKPKDGWFLIEKKETSPVGKRGLRA